MARQSVPRAGKPAVEALVTDPSQRRLLVVSLPAGRVVSEVNMPGEPQFITGNPGPPLVVSSLPGDVSLVGGIPLRTLQTFTGFASAAELAVAPDGAYAYATDENTGRLTVIGLYNRRVLSRIAIGGGAHHVAFTPDERQVWVALGEAATTIVILSTVKGNPPPPASPVLDPGAPSLIGHFDPGFLVHDLAFSPDGRQVWITAADASFTGVFSPRTRRLLFRVPVGPPPQHVALAGGYAYLTSGYGSRIEQVARGNGRVVRTAAAPYGSFDLAAADGYVVTVSLLRGTLAIYNSSLRLLQERRLAPSLKDVVLSRIG